MNHPALKILLSPFALLYGLIVSIRNTMFDLKLLPSKVFDLPIICVGNISVGGTGKTPHVEFLIRTLQNEFNLSSLSRGYKRKTKGFLLANEEHKAYDLGDEPYQMARKFPEINVAVDANRVEGIQNLLTEVPDLEMVILDDAFQHRYVHAGLNILLVDYNHNIWDDMLLPAGRLREGKRARYRADIIIMTKCPKNLNVMEQRNLEYQMKLSSKQYMYFSFIDYGKMYPVFDGELQEAKKVLLVTGIAHPESLQKHLESQGVEVENMAFSDHHEFSKEDVKKIKEKYEKGNFDFILTTEKDAVRMQSEQDLWSNLEKELFYISIEIDFLNNKREEFIHNILTYARNNKRNNILYQRKG